VAVVINEATIGLACAWNQFHDRKIRASYYKISLLKVEYDIKYKHFSIHK